MVERIAAFLADLIVKNNNRDEDHEIYFYGLQIVVNTVISISLVLISGFMLHNFWNTLFFLICYCSVRLFAGGYHANTNNKCIVIFLTGYFLFVTILLHFNMEFNGIHFFLLMMVNIIVWLLSPVEAINNPIPVQRKQWMKKKAFFLSLILTIVIFIFAYKKYPIYSWGEMGLIWISMILILGKISNNSKYKEKII